MDRQRAFGLALVLVSACAFGSGALFAKPVYATGVGWVTLSTWRFALGAALAWAWLLLVPGRRAALATIDRRGIAIAVGLGVLYTGNSGTYYAGLESVPVSLAALIVYVYPAIVAVLTLRFGRRIEGTRAWLALGLALLGVALAVGGIDPSAVPPAAGILLISASPVIYALWIVLVARLSGERREGVGHEAGGGADAAAVGAIMLTATAATYGVISMVTGSPVAPDRVPAGAWFGLIGIGVISTFVAVQGFYAGARRIGAAQAALVSTIEPIYTVALAALLLGERLQPVQLVGGAMIIGGVLLAQARASADMPSLRLADE